MKKEKINNPLPQTPEDISNSVVEAVVSLPPRILVACEYSGIVREAFAAAGFDAWSCDILETEIPGKHIKDNVLDHLNDGWDMMIGHPPCTYLSFAANHVWYKEGRARKRLEALDFFLRLWEAPIEKICLENPVGIVDRVIEKHTQIINPYYFGDDEVKRTCLWLKGLPKLIHKKEDDLFNKKTHIDKPKPMYTRYDGKSIYFSEGKHGGHERSKFFPSVAAAMAGQWSGTLIKIKRSN